MIVEDAVFTPPEADAFARQIALALGRRETCSSRVRVKMEPRPPYESVYRLLPLEGTRSIPWLLDQEPRLACTLSIRVRNGFAKGSVHAQAQTPELEKILRQTKRELRALFNETTIYGDAVIDAHVEYEDRLGLSADERSLELCFDLTFSEV